MTISCFQHQSNGSAKEDLAPTTTLAQTNTYFKDLIETYDLEGFKKKMEEKLGEVY